MFFRTFLYHEDDQFVFSQKTCNGSESLKGLIPEFFTTRAPGVHILVVCSSSNEELPKEIIQVEASLDNAECTVFDENTQVSDERTRRYFAISQQDSYDALVKKVASYIEHCYGQELSAFKNRKQRFLMTVQTADEFQDCLTEAMKKAKYDNHCHTLFLVFVLPAQWFEEFKSAENHFPLFIEYVVLGEIVDAIIKEKDKVIEELRNELSSKKQELTEQRTSAEKLQKGAEVLLERLVLLENTINYLLVGKPLTEEMLEVVRSTEAKISENRNEIQKNVKQKVLFNKGE
jgi:hypothetical protein